jgi:hypothetical protein
MSYYCKFCDYETTSQSNFCNHKKTKKHIKKSISDIDKQHKSTSSIHQSTLQSTLQSTEMYTETATNIFNCKICNFKTEHKSSYYRHKKKCQKANELNMDLEEKEKYKELKIKLEYEIKEKELYKKLEQEKTELLNNFMNNANQIINKTQDNAKLSTEAIQNVSISAIKYANEKYQNAPPLLTLDNFNINNLDFDNIKDRESITETLVYHAKLKSLDKLLGEHIIKNYKKEDPKTQSIHTTDCSRLNYIVKELINNVSKWEIDKNGIKICSKIIKPLIERCIELLLEHQQKLLDDMSKGEFNNKNDINTIISVLMSIDKGSLECEINKYIAPHFNLNK